MLIHKVDIASIRNQIEAAEHMQDAFKFKECRKILLDMAHEIITKVKVEEDIK